MRAMKGFVAAVLTAGLVALTAAPAQAGHTGALTIADLTTGAFERNALLTIKFEKDFDYAFGYGSLKDAKVEVKLSFESGDPTRLTVSGPLENAQLTSTLNGDKSLAARDGHDLLIDASSFPAPLKRIDVKTFESPGNVVDGVIRKPVALEPCDGIDDAFHDAFRENRKARFRTTALAHKQRKLENQLDDALDAGNTSAADELQVKLDHVSTKFALKKAQALLWRKRSRDINFAGNSCN
jgi:hypothetical protein